MFNKRHAFTGEYAFLSNMYELENPVTAYCKAEFFNVESAYQISKKLFPTREEILQFSSISGKEAKKLGRNLRIRHSWEQVKYQVMLDLVRQKFSKNPELLEKLLKLDEAIVEYNWWNDTYWGVCNGVGKNYLGEILETVKKENV